MDAIKAFHKAKKEALEQKVDFYIIRTGSSTYGVMREGMSFSDHDVVAIMLYDQLYDDEIKVDIFSIQYSNELQGLK